MKLLAFIFEQPSSFGLSETKLFRFHGIYKKKEIESSKQTSHLFSYGPCFSEILDPPLLVMVTLGFILPCSYIFLAVPWVGL